jgi:DNA-binding transcriptional MerR regulator
MLKIRDFARLGQVSVRTLRYYDELGLLTPVQVDRYTGYRLYSATQLPQLYRILVLKDLGCSLDEIALLLRADQSASRLRALLQQKRAELQRQLQDEQARLQRVEARILQIEQEIVMPSYEIVLKRADALTVAALRGHVRADHEVDLLFTEVYAHLRHFPVTYPAPAIAIWDDQDRGIDDAGFDVVAAVPIAGAAAPSARIVIETLPAVERMACVVHHGSLDQLAQAYDSLYGWAHANGYRVVGASRTVAVQVDRSAHPQDGVIEVQLPIAVERRLAALDDLLSPAERVLVTERARQVVAAMIEEARQDAAAVQTQHLLLGLMGVEKGFAAAVLRELGFTPERVRGAPRPAGPEPEVVIEGQRWSPPLRSVVAQSAQVAQQLAHDYLGTEHLLIALMRCRDASVQAALEDLGLTAMRVEQAVGDRLSQAA